MLATAVPPTELAVLEDQIQQRLHDQLPEISPLHVQCTLKQNTLLVVVEHRAPKLIHPRRVFRILETVFAETGFSTKFRALFYVKLEGRSQPYHFHNFIPRPPVVDVAAQVEALTPAGIAAQGALVHHPEPAPVLSPDPPQPDEFGDPADQFIDVADPDTIVIPSQLPDGVGFADLDEEEVEPLPYPEALEPEPEPMAPGENRLWLPVIIAGTVISLTLFFGSVYALSRPCVLRGCRTLTVAQTLANEAVETLQDPPSGAAVLQAQEQLDRALLLLGTIPPWSGKYEEAQALLRGYGRTVDNATVLVDALKTANAAANLTQNPPLTVAQWQASLDRWQEAIAGLESLNPQDDFYRFARQKVQEYRQNLTIIQERLATEQKAVENLALAEEAAKVAAVRLNIAQSLADVALADRTWQAAINALNQVPATTTVYSEARRLLGVYQPQATVTANRHTQERFAEEAYNQGVRLAEQATAAAAQNRWEDAIAAWQQGISSIRQIPQDSFKYIRAQPLLEVYAQGLSRAESRLEGSLQVRQARADLNQICTVEGKQICVYTVTNEKITVRLTPAYVERVRQTSESARSQNNIEAQAGVMDHVFALEQSLERVSDRAKIPLEIYTTNNVLVKSYNPS
ncbi:MAG: hypothetical protein EA366_08550 [Spirulina sp. DLM2.Bin59]|nr:MAG: hypothetical protein EA366_08550 [Spirulina sp. DLM2.Bin59]